MRFHLRITDEYMRTEYTIELPLRLPSPSHRYQPISTWVHLPWSSPKALEPSKGAFPRRDVPKKRIQGSSRANSRVLLSTLPLLSSEISGALSLIPSQARFQSNTSDLVMDPLVFSSTTRWPSAAPSPSPRSISPPLASWKTKMYHALWYQLRNPKDDQDQDRIPTDTLGV